MTGEGDKKNDKTESRRQFMITTAATTGGAATGIDPVKITRWLAIGAEKGPLSFSTAEKLKELTVLDGVFEVSQKTLANAPRIMMSTNVQAYFAEELSLVLENMYMFAYRQSRLWEEFPENIGEVAAVVAQAVKEHDALKKRKRALSDRQSEFEKGAADTTTEKEKMAMAKERAAIKQEEEKIQEKEREIDAKYNVPEYVKIKFSGCSAEDIVNTLARSPLERFEQAVSGEALSALHDPALLGARSANNELRIEVARLLPNFIQNRLPSLLRKIRAEAPAQYEEYKQRGKRPKTEQRQTESKPQPVKTKADPDPAYFDYDHPYAQLMEDKPVNWRDFASSKKDPEKKR